jgi:hypothetical protein
MSIKEEAEVKRKEILHTQCVELATNFITIIESANRKIQKCEQAIAILEASDYESANKLYREVTQQPQY